MIIMIIVTLCRNDSLLSGLRYDKWPTRLDCAFELSDFAQKQAKKRNVSCAKFLQVSACALACI